MRTKKDRATIARNVCLQLVEQTQDTKQLQYIHYYTGCFTALSRLSGYLAGSQIDVFIKEAIDYLPGFHAQFQTSLKEKAA